MAPTIVLLHGFTHTGASWEPVRAAIGPGYLSLAPDLRGHGAAAARRPVDLAGVIADLETALAPGSTLCGYSMGGRIALHLALNGERRDRIARLVLIGASPGVADLRERDTRRAADEALADELERMSIDAFAERWARTPVLAGQPPEVRERVHQDRLRNTTSGLAAALRGLGAGALPSLWERLADLAMPAILIAGERDGKFTETAAAMAQAIPDARVEIVPGAGHAVHLEQPERIATVLANGGVQ